MPFAEMLVDIFAVDVTTVVNTRIQCDIRRRAWRNRVYGGTMMGSILRCAHCDKVLLRFVRTRSAPSLDIGGARSLVVPGKAALGGPDVRSLSYLGRLTGS